MLKLCCKIIGLALLLFIYGCNGNKKSLVPIISSIQTFEDELILNSVDSFFIPEILDLAGWQIENDKIIFLSYGIHENFIRIYSYPDCHFLYSSGKKGQGPNEFITINWGKTVQRNEFVIYDIMKSELNLYSALSDSLYCKKKYNLGRDWDGLCKPYTQILHIKDDYFLMKFDSPNESKLELVDLNQKNILSQQENMLREKYKKRMSYTPFDFCFSVCGNQLLLAYYYADRMELYDITSNKITPKLIIGDNKDQSDLKDYNTLKCYNISLVSDGDYFYCLKSQDGSEERGNVLEVFSEKIIPICRLNLDKSIQSIAVDTNGNIWGYVEKDNGLVLYKYVMKGIIRDV